MEKISKELAFIVNLWIANSVLSKKFDASLGAVHGLGFNEFIVLMLLRNGHNSTMRRIDLANSVGLTASGITRVLAPMEKIGLVAKEQNPRDARVSLVKITVAGDAILNDASSSLKQKAGDLLNDISRSSLSDSIEVFKLITKDNFNQL